MENQVAVVDFCSAEFLLQGSQKLMMQVLGGGAWTVLSSDSVTEIVPVVAMIVLCDD